MPNLDSLVQRIDAEFAAVEAHLKNYQQQQVKEYEGRRQRLEQLEKVYEQLGEVWRPRLDALAQKFGDKVKVTPRVTPSAREATFAFQSKLARINLRFAASSDREVRKLILTYDLEILPVLMRFESHAEAEFPIDKVDPDAVAQWIDDRIVGFVKTYLSLHENELYLKDVMVVDPIADVQFPKFAAASTLEHAGKTYYFIGEATRREFEQQKGLAAK
jgi:YHS domain-containing protein